MTHEALEDFTWQENKAYADIICNGIKAVDIQRLEFMADNLMGDGDA